MRTLRLTLICSGITADMRKGRFPCDGPLEKLSMRRANSLRSRLGAADAVLAGPTLRARQTADLLELDVTVREDLRDQDYGSWAGKSVSEIETELPGAVGAWLADPAYSPGDGESLEAVAKRTSAFLAETGSKSGHVIAITHAAVVRAALLHAIGAPLASFWRVDAPPLGLTDLRCDGSRWILRAHGLYPRSSA